jgi:hypothetical protein
MTQLNADSGVFVAVGLAFGGGMSALGRMLSTNRRTDKVDALGAVAAAYDRLAERTNKHVDDLSDMCKALQQRVDFLERELRKRDEFLFASIGDPEQRAAAATKLTEAAATAAEKVLNTAAHAADSSVPSSRVDIRVDR